MKEKIEKAFAKYYPNKRLLATKINDMHFSVGYDDGHEDGVRNQEGVVQDAYEFWTNNFDGNMDKMKEEIGVGAYTFGHDCYTHTGIQPDER